MTGTNITNYDEAWAKQAAAYAEQEQMTGGAFLSIRGGVLTLGEEQMPDNQACVIVLDAVKENTYYGPETYDPNNPSPPICYAFGRGAEELGPHPSMQTDLSYFKPQASDCASCPWNVFGSADKGRGKACQNRRRLALIPAGFYSTKRGSRDMELQIFTDPQHFQTADIAFLKLPVLSVKNWSKYVTQLSTSIQRSPAGVITRLFVVPDAKAQYAVHFEMLEEVPNELAAAIMARQEEAIKAVIQGYKPPEDKPTQPAQRGSLRGLRR